MKTSILLIAILILVTVDLPAFAGSRDPYLRACAAAINGNRFLGGGDYSIAPLGGLVKTNRQGVQYYDDKSGTTVTIDTVTLQCSSSRSPDVKSTNDVLAEVVSGAVDRFRRAYSGPSQTVVERTPGFLSERTKINVHWTEKQYEHDKAELLDALKACLKSLGGVAQRELSQLNSDNSLPHAGRGPSVLGPDSH